MGLEDPSFVVANQLNRVLEQQVVQKPIGWTGRTVEPFTVLGGGDRFRGPLGPFGAEIRTGLTSRWPSPPVRALKRESPMGM